MHPPLLLAADVLGDGSPVAMGLVIGLGGGLLVVGIAWGEARVQISAIREWKRQKDAQDEATEKRVTALEVRESRATERIDNLAAQLARIERKVDLLLEESHGRHRDVAS